LRQEIVRIFGAPLGKSTMAKLYSPAIGEGPPVAARSGRPFLGPNS
jgi:hypothetical protein